MAQPLTLILARNLAQNMQLASFLVDADGTLAETGGECKEGMDVAYNGVWGYHPLVISCGQPIHKSRYFW